jgi:predicted transcriptional regulator
MEMALGCKEDMSDFDPDLLEDLMQMTVRVRPHGFGITAAEFAEALGVTWQAARDKLLVKEKAGELTSEIMRSEGRTSKVYYKA